MTNEIGASSLKQASKGWLIVTSIMFGAAILLLWGWDTVAVDLFAAPVAKFKHAVAFELVILALALLGGLALRFARHRQ